MADLKTDTQTWRNLLSEPDLPGVPDVPSTDSIAIQPQYAHTVRLAGLCDAIQDDMDASPELQEMYEKCINPETAIGVFLDWIGERVGIGRSLTLNGSAVTLEDEDYRFLIKVKALANVGAESVQQLNTLLGALLPDCKVWVVDQQDMTIEVHIVGAITDTQLAILQTYGIPNRPAGVLVNFFVVNTDIFGFNGSGLQPFDQAKMFQTGVL